MLRFGSDLPRSKLPNARITFKNVFSFCLFVFIFIMSELFCHAFSARIIEVRAGDMLVIAVGGWGKLSGCMGSCARCTVSRIMIKLVSL